MSRPVFHLSVLFQNENISGQYLPIQFEYVSSSIELYDTEASYIKLYLFRIQIISCEVKDV